MIEPRITLMTRMGRRKFLDSWYDPVVSTSSLLNPPVVDDPPSITVSNRQRMMPVKLSALREFARRALNECVKLRSPRPNWLAEFQEVSVVLVSDRRMTELHRRFLGQATPTDVITFQHGEIFVSTETARRQARRFGTSAEHELRLYIVHGLLHLFGLDDKTPTGAAEMKRVQEKLVASLL